MVKIERKRNNPYFYLPSHRVPTANNFDARKDYSLASYAEPVLGGRYLLEIVFMSICPIGTIPTAHGRYQGDRHYTFYNRLVNYPRHIYFIYRNNLQNKHLQHQIAASCREIRILAFLSGCLYLKESYDKAAVFICENCEKQRLLPIRLTNS